MFKYHDYHKYIVILTINVFIFCVRNKTNSWKVCYEVIAGNQGQVGRAQCANFKNTTDYTPQLTETRFFPHKTQMV